MNAIAFENRIPSVRGLLLRRNARGAAFDQTLLQKWLRLNAAHYQTEKLDVAAEPGEAALWETLLPFAAQQGVALSLRTACIEPPERLGAMRGAGLFDVCLAPAAADWEQIAAWAEACREAELPFRVRLLPRHLALPGAPATILDAIEGAAVLNLALADHFAPSPRGRGRGGQRLQRIVALAETAAAAGMEVNLLQMPFCQVPEALWPHVVNGPQLHHDHQQYQPASETLARTLYRLTPARADKFIEVCLGKDASPHAPIDRALIPWILTKPRVYFRAWLLHKLFRHRNWLHWSVWPLPDEAAAQTPLADPATAGPACAGCRFVRICDHDSEVFKQALPGLEARTIPGEPLPSPLPLLEEQFKHFDAIDAPRRQFPEHLAQAAREALRITLETPPSREIPADSYEVENGHTHRMPGAVQWTTFSNGELVSTPLTRLEPPFTMALTFGGGIADQIGFRFGRHARVMCPMIDYTHRLILHVDASGHYALLRDQELVHPTAFAGGHPAPRKLAGRLEPRIAVFNLSAQLVTQTLLIWEGTPEARAPGKVLVSIVVVSTCFARRLQAVLLSLLHQEGIPLDAIEIIVAYVPGIDSTDDLLDSIHAAHPGLRLLRAPFSARHRKAKGFMINEASAMAAGEWVMLLDSDIVLPPDFLARLAALPESARFAAPAGRKMLTPAATARILLGETRPWESYGALLEDPGEYRHMESGEAPIGFCQCVRRAVLAEVRYAELDHFEGADYYFGQDVIARHGKPVLLDDRPVLHLDHGGSQWYGASKQM